VTSDPLPVARPVSNARDWRSVLQAVFSLLAAALTIGQGIITIFLGVFDTPMPGFADFDPGMRVTLGVVSTVLGLLLIPSGLSAIFRL